MTQVSFFLKSAFGISLFSVIPFIAAGRIDFLQGWVYYALSLFGLGINIFLIRNNAQLMEERSTLASNTKSWDKKILGLSFLLTIITSICAGLDARFHLFPSPDYGYILIGCILTLIGQILFAVAKSQNNFFSSVARIQSERGHKVCDRGLYGFVRHPGYFGMMISWIGFPLIFNSLWSVIPVFLAIMLLIVRTALEDHMLQNELDGYMAYTKKTPYRVFPFVW